MKAIFLLFIPMLSAQHAYSQQAPDFTLTDSDGTVWNLYEQIGMGKTVVLDFFYVDCVPCQSQSPEVAIMYDEYQTANVDVLVLGISNRDQDAEVDQFDQTYGITYPTGGTDGGGDIITELYQSWFPFFGWPSYGVVCSDSSIIWGIMPSVPGVPELRSAVSQCLGSSSVNEAADIRQFAAIEHDQIRITNSKVRGIYATDLAGRQLFNLVTVRNGQVIQLPNANSFILSIELQNNQLIHQKVFR